LAPLGRPKRLCTRSARSSSDRPLSAPRVEKRERPLAAAHLWRMLRYRVPQAVTRCLERAKKLCRAGYASPTFVEARECEAPPNQAYRGCHERSPLIQPPAPARRSSLQSLLQPPYRGPFRHLRYPVQRRERTAPSFGRRFGSTSTSTNPPLGGPQACFSGRDPRQRTATRRCANSPHRAGSARKPNHHCRLPVQLPGHPPACLSEP